MKGDLLDLLTTAGKVALQQSPPNRQSNLWAIRHSYFKPWNWIWKLH